MLEATGLEVAASAGGASLVGAERLELSRCFHQRGDSPPRLPITPRPQRRLERAERFRRLPLSRAIQLTPFYPAVTLAVRGCGV